MRETTTESVMDRAEHTMVREGNQTHEGTYWMTPFIQNSRTGKANPWSWHQYSDYCIPKGDTKTECGCWLQREVWFVKSVQRHTFDVWTFLTLCYPWIENLLGKILGKLLPLRTAVWWNRIPCQEFRVSERSCAWGWCSVWTGGQGRP